MQPFLIVKNTDLIFYLQNDFIIHRNLPGGATTKQRLGIMLICVSHA